jgi:hypothetical protein
MTINKTRRVPLAARIVLSASLLVAGVSCSSDDKSSSAKATPQTKKETAPDGRTRSVTRTPGEAGGITEEAMTASVTVSAIDPVTRKITLKDAEGDTGSYTAPPEMRNFDQLRVGDHVKATLLARMNIFVDQQGPAEPAEVKSLTRTPAGEKPGAVLAQTYQTVATVKSIDATKRQAVLEFHNGQLKTIPVHPDVELSRYKPGDNVVIQVTQQLSVVSKAP